MAESTINGITFTDDDVINLDTWIYAVRHEIPAKYYVFHQHGKTLGVAIAQSIVEAFNVLILSRRIDDIGDGTLEELGLKHEVVDIDFDVSFCACVNEGRPKQYA